jgi:hypothetical protein
MKLRDRSPDLIVHNAQVHTLDDDNLVAEAIAIKDGRILALGTSTEIKRLSEPGTRSVNAGGRTALPGFLDGHIHLLEVGIDMSWLRLNDCQSIEEMMEMVRQRADETPPGQWIMGRGWMETRFKEERLPTRQDIDAVTTEHPVVLMRRFQAYVVNTRVLQIVGIDEETPDGEWGPIGRDPSGVPNGMLWGSAKNAIQAHLPQPSVAEMKDALRPAIEEMLQFGVTSIIEPGLRPWEIGAYQSLYDDGDLSLRINALLSWYGYWANLEDDEILAHRVQQMGVHSGFGNEWLRIGALKMAVDVAFIPPADEEQVEEEDDMPVFLRLDFDALDEYFQTAHELMWDVGIHVHSDRLQEKVSEVFAETARRIPRPDARHSIIHGNFPTPRTLDLMAEYNVANVAQPVSFYFNGFGSVENERYRENFKPGRRYLDHGVRLVASSDKPYQESANPFLGLYAMVSRKDKEGYPVAPHEAISREEALRTYTAAGAWLTREEHLKGTLEIGKLADIILIDRDYFSVSEEQIKDIQVDMTILDGEIVHDRMTEGLHGD